MRVDTNAKFILGFLRFDFGVCFNFAFSIISGLGCTVCLFYVIVVQSNYEGNEKYWKGTGKKYWKDTGNWVTSST